MFEIPHVGSPIFPLQIVMPGFENRTYLINWEGEDIGG